MSRWWPWKRNTPTPASPRGTEDQPHVRGDRNLTPWKYQCVRCHEWIVEPQIDQILRHKGRQYQDDPHICNPLCEACSAITLHEDWTRLQQKAEQEWKETFDKGAPQ